MFRWTSEKAYDSMSFVTVFSIDGSGSLLLELLCEWLNARDIIQFDTAASLKAHRRLLQSCYPRCSWQLNSVVECCNLTSEEYESLDPYRFVQMAAWVMKRSINVNDDLDHWTTVDDEFIRTFQSAEVCAPFLRKMNIISVSVLISKESMRQLLTTFPNIEKLALTLEDNGSNNLPGSHLTSLASFWRLKDVACCWWHGAIRGSNRYSFLLGCRDTLEAFSPAQDTSKEEFLYIVANFPGLKELHLPFHIHYNELHSGYSPVFDGFSLFLRDVARLRELRVLELNAPVGWGKNDIETLVRPLSHLTHLEMFGNMEIKSEIPNFLHVLTFCKDIRFFTVNQNRYWLTEEKGVMSGKLTLWDSMELGKDNLGVFVEGLNMLPHLDYLHLFPAEDVFNNPLLSKAVGLCRHKLAITTLHMPFKAKQLSNAVSLLAALPALSRLTVKFRSAVKSDWIQPFVEAVVKHCSRLESLTLEGIETERTGLSPSVFKKLALGLPNLTSLCLNNCKSPQLNKQCLLDVASTRRVWDLLYLPSSRFISFRDLCDVVEAHGLEVKNIQIVTERPWRCYRVAHGLYPITLSYLEAFDAKMDEEGNDGMIMYETNSV